MLYLIHHHIFALFIGILCWSPSLSAHDEFYPHHQEDFESLTRLRELQGTVLLITAAFLGILTILIYFGFQKSKKEPDEPDESVQTRLSTAATAAAKTAQQVRSANGTISEAIEAALATYAEASGIVWRTSTGVKGNTVRCKIGSDIIMLSIHVDSDTEIVRLRAERGFPYEVNAVVELRVRRNRE